MAKVLEGYEKVVVVKFNNCSIDYYFALYDNDIHVGDEVLVSGGTSDIPTVKQILTAEEAKKYCKVQIISEVICKVDTKAYKKRVAAREEKTKIRAELDRKKKELQKTRDDEFYAAMDPGFAELYAKYNKIGV